MLSARLECNSGSIARIAFLLVGLLMTSGASAQLLTFRDLLARTPVPAPTHVIPYGSHPDQVGELWLPKTSANPHPIVVLTHGGCWRADLPGRELVAFLSEALREKGAAVWSIGYRRIGTKSENFAPYPDTFLDVARAVDSLREVAKKHPLDLTNIITTGHSAGGHLALWVAARPRIPVDSVLYNKTALPIRATVGIAALPDLAYARAASAHACGADTVDLLIDSKARGANALRDTSVTNLLPLGVTTTLISGTYDGIAAPAHALRYSESAKAKAETVELLTLNNAGHFELIAPWTTAGEAVVARIIMELKILK